ncbi:DUF5993 family protein [Vibrio marisflavi]|uniref:Uncharacterized protein n=1 Tax=Vibrio marisflavi CECT 7928 TaxID=634439 RepID=A0ABM8ZZF4_9VIBR|nr:DUF5993 family protein [Vibrio marisflavi]CAH0536293.1 hypothetical protein VMF7928_00314 [Vibrio marisflavi CECT 7928]
MMSLLFLIILIAMMCAFKGKKCKSYIFFAVGLLLSLYWLRHHATDTLSILL